VRWLWGEGDGGEGDGGIIDARGVLEGWFEGGGGREATGSDATGIEGGGREATIGALHCTQKGFHFGLFLSADCLISGVLVVLGCVS
jgi:hypothetical protein